MSDQSSTPDDSVQPAADDTPSPDTTASTEINWLDALREVIDPELMVNIVDLGLIYSVSADEEAEQGVAVEMTLTSPACPAGPQIVQQAKMALERLHDVDQAKVTLTMSPPWTPERMTDDARDQLGIF
jgi:metal-sulfur cluster biosynthetic enzyme